MILSVWAAVWLAQNPPAQPQNSLWQYGVLGVFAAILLGVVKVLFSRQEKLHDQAIARADKAEEELSKLNALIREQLVAQLTQTATALSRAADVLADQRTERRGAR